MKAVKMALGILTGGSFALVKILNAVYENDFIFHTGSDGRKNELWTGLVTNAVMPICCFDKIAMNG
jgi:hypothetical protein